MSTCGRPTSSRKPCKKSISDHERACSTHETPEDIAYREGFEDGRRWLEEVHREARKIWTAQGEARGFAAGKAQGLAEGRSGKSEVADVPKQPEQLGKFAVHPFETTYYNKPVTWYRVECLKCDTSAHECRDQARVTAAKEQHRCPPSRDYLPKAVKVMTGGTTWSTRLDLQVGDLVICPYWYGAQLGTVTALDSDYDGPLSAITKLAAYWPRKLLRPKTNGPLPRASRTHGS